MQKGIKLWVPKPLEFVYGKHVLADEINNVKSIIYDLFVTVSMRCAKMQAINSLPMSIYPLKWKRGIARVMAVASLATR